MIREILSPNVARSRFIPDLHADSEERDAVAGTILDDFRNRAIFVSFAPDIPRLVEPAKQPARFRGLAYFIGLVDGIDDITDKNVNFGLMPQDELLHAVLTTPITIGKRAVYGQDLLKLLLETVPDLSSEISSFMNQASASQTGYQGQPGTYDFNEAYSYRTVTTGGMIRMCSLISGVTNPSRIERNITSSLGWQMLDDATDVLNDINFNLKNLFVGMAHSTDASELDVLVESARAPRKKNIVKTARVIQSLKHTKEAYQRVYCQLENNESKYGRLLGRSLQRLLFGS